MASRNVSDKCENQPISLTQRVLRSASRDHSANNSLTEIDTSYLTKSAFEKITSMVNDSPQTPKKSTPRSTKASKSVTKPKGNSEFKENEKSFCNDSHSSEDIDFSIIDPKYSSKKSKSSKGSKMTPKPKPKVILRKPSRPLVLSDSDFDEEKMPSTSKSQRSINTRTVQFESESPKVVLHKLDLGSLNDEEVSRSNRKLVDSSSSSSSDSYDEDDDEYSSCSEDKSTTSRNKSSLQNENSINSQFPVARDKGLPKVSTEDHNEESSSYNYEAYFLANTRIKFKNENAPSGPSAIPNDCRKGVARKPRKGTRGLGGDSATLRNIPTCPVDPNFSVSREAAKAVAKLSKQRHQVNTDSDSEESEDNSSGQVSNDHSKEIKNLLKDSVESQFPHWILLMSEGFNIVVHGFGSKIAVFDRFKKFIGDERLVVTINGLYSKLNTRSFLVNFCDALELEDPIKVSGSNLDLVADLVVSELMEIDDHPDVFLFLMHLDRISTNYPALLTVLCNLAKLEWIHILASCDHVNASLGLTHAQASVFNFCWFPCSTFLPYRQEFTWNPNVFGDQGSSSSEGSKQTLQYVLKSLTTNARKAFTILASMQLATPLPSTASKSNGDSDDHGVDFTALLRRCRESFIAHSEAALKALLVEFIDHKLISHGKSKAIGNKLVITLDRDTLQQIANDKL